MFPVGSYRCNFVKLNVILVCVPVLQQSLCFQIKCLTAVPRLLVLGSPVHHDRRLDLTKVAALLLPRLFFRVLKSFLFAFFPPARKWSTAAACGSSSFAVRGESSPPSAARSARCLQEIRRHSRPPQALDRSQLTQARQPPQALLQRLMCLWACWWHMRG